MTIRNDHSSVNEVFYWKEISIFQNQEVLKIGTDAILLGSWIAHLSLSPNSILDAGSGTGVLSLMMAAMFPDATVNAIDHQEEAVKLTRLNFAACEFKDRLKVIHGDVLKELEGELSYDLVICNPPFFFNQLKPTDITRKNSRHTVHSIQLWMNALSARCKEGGKLSLIIPYAMASAWIQAGNTTGMYCQVRKNISSFKDDHEPVRSLLHFGSSLQPLQMDGLTIYESPGHYTKAYRDFTGL